MFSTFCLIVLLVSNIILIFKALSLNGKLAQANSANLLLKESYENLISKYNKLSRSLSKTSSPPTIVDKLLKTRNNKKTTKSETSPSHSSPSTSSHYDYSGGYSSCSGGDSGSSSCDSGSSGGSYD
ncbi:hypothetical protein FDH01_gp189 [Acinetobacter phage vB_AbaM_ME3]|uniref:Uncharacterized protein n=1 Tax=Acinetobacter phage vB_AbaM_ME3 TaxID=1837876 RepID=A0A172Q0W9_9CAUD|nr:hypothetical protein FDH01_gp189 [Acinetobacter phage vB_AbaM_ME3]AND75433.1 hypothetical protein ME3_272 [Acinetobacter phage vB_AbaM_ME3]